jgi:predicted Zn finger-like uncharacterized protein
MAKVIGTSTPGAHKDRCPKCGAWFEFTNDEIYRDDFGLEVVCPNCNSWVCIG